MGPARVTFEVPPGTLQLKMTVEGSGAETLDSETRELTVPDLTGPQTLLGTPGVYRARTARDAQQLKNNADAVPAAGREFLRSDRLLVKVPTYGPGMTPPAVTARLLNRTGQPMNDVPVVLGAPAAAVALIELALAPLAPGEYVLEITVTGSSGDAKEMVGFRVTT